MSILILILIGIFAFKNINDYKGASDWVHHTQKVISQVERVLLDVQDIETEQRLYVITGEEKYLEYYDQGLKNVRNDYLATKKLIADNPKQLSLLNSIYAKISLRIEFSKRAVDLRRTDGFEAAKKLVSTGRGENLMKAIRLLVENFIYREETLLIQRLEVANKDFSTVTRIILSSITLAIVFVLIALYLFIHDYNKRIASEKKVIDSEVRIKKMLDSLPVGVFIVDNKGKSYYSNSKSRQILGKGIMPGANANELPDVYRAYQAGTNSLYPTNKQPILQALKGNNVLGLEDIEIERDGRRVPLRISSTYITDSEEKIEYAISVFEDITDVKENEKKLVLAKKLAEEAVILKETFLANMSHEIRTPMNAILGFTDLLLRKNLPDQEKDYVKTIKTSGENLLRIINDILDVSKIDSGMMTFEKHPISIKEIFCSLNILLSNKALEKKLNLSFECEDKLNFTVLGDPTRLTQIIVNIVGNAIKFTKKGGVEVLAKVKQETTENYEIEFSVKDTGIGIADDKLQFIFERFRQAEVHTTRNYGGTGLGLSIAKQLIELQGGSLDIKSAEGLGSVFSFVLPFQKTNEIYRVDANHHALIDADQFQHLNILLIEDNPVNIKFIESLFLQYQIKINVAENGRIGVEKVEAGKYDLILMDIEMPEMNGYDATKYIREELKSNVPIIAMTAHAMSGEKEKCLQLGMNDYISKPINTELLFEKILTSTSSIKKAIPSQNDSLINLEFLSKAVLGNKETMISIIDIFLEQIPEDLLEINAAVVKSDFATIKKRAHRMKSSASILGIDRLTMVLEELEILGQKAQDIGRIAILNNQLIELCTKSIQEAQDKKHILI
ncbi:MAG: CHASE3 domain-containing protein [Bacteroidota bacterium]